MSSAFWYYSILATGIGMMVFTMYKKGNIIDLLAFYLASVAFSYLCEVLVLFVFRSYTYKPGVFSDPIAEDLFTHLILNGLFWGGTILLISAFSLRYYWIALISCGYMIIEVLFIKLGIYEHNWWRIYMTGIGSFIIFMIAKGWYKKLSESNHRFLRYIAFYFISWLILEATTLLLLLLGKQNYSLGLVNNTYLNDIFFSVPYQLALSYVYVFFVCTNEKWYWKFAPLLINLFFDSIFINTNILHLHGTWNLLFLTIARSIGLVIYILLEKYTLNKSSKDLLFA